ncbi:VCBS repeat-containing protein [Streptomyces sp. S.PNR 29]|uniref:FG-GAP repeat domain-containing protein n=1 Tax=Streptomyces sp. S.PNR 29 TaxID=2973805 RepID=UPI0025B1FC77|nr:VCBS repeat-containing protein [Streptomyces sp. S.PNR 29]MDN0200972.1 VCBS repeat-containing protein [Streptomyces sp. S.PNR 29]
MSQPALPRTRRAVVVATAVLAAVGAAATLPAASAHAAPSVTLRQDFDGDGYEDLAVAAPDGDVDGRHQAGYVAVLYGDASGLSAGSRKVYSQASTGVPGTPEAYDHFGSRLTEADLDGDGFTDLVVEASGEEWVQDGNARHGNHTVLWGGPGGFASGKVLPAVGSGSWQAGQIVAGDFNGDGHQDLVGPGGGPVRFGPFGRDGVPASTQSGAPLVDGDMYQLATVAGDADGDGITDLVTMSRSYDWDDDHEYGYYLNYVRGSRDGLRPPVILKDAQGEHLDPQNATLALGDLNGDRRADLVMGGYALRIVYGTPNGPAAATPQVITQDTPGVPGVQEGTDDFGSALSVGDVDGDGYGDVLAGIPHEDFGGLQDAGTFAVVPGGPDGPTGAGTKVLSQNSADVPGTAENGDLFGGNVHLVDGNGDGRAEPVVAATEEDAVAGAVWVFRSGSDGVTAKGSFAFGPRALGMAPPEGARLGASFPR